VVDDVAGAVAALRAHGANRIALVGASPGASTALPAGAALRPPVAAVVSL
jgi:acetyl esterase/lipase